MKITYRTSALQKVCDNEKKMLKELGTLRAQKLQQRLMNLKDVSCLTEMFILRAQDAMHWSLIGTVSFLLILIIHIGCCLYLRMTPYPEKVMEESIRMKLQRSK